MCLQLHDRLVVFVRRNQIRLAAWILVVGGTNAPFLRVDEIMAQHADPTWLMIWEIVNEADARPTVLVQVRTCILAGAVGGALLLFVLLGLERLALLTHEF